MQSSKEFREFAVQRVALGAKTLCEDSLRKPDVL
jgi:hypothetical protein